MENNISTIGYNIKRIRESLGISAYQLSQMAGVSNSTVYDAEKGSTQSLRSDTIAKIAKALGVTSKDLIEANTEVYVMDDIEEGLETFLDLSSDMKLDDIIISKEELDVIKINLKLSFEIIRKERLHK